MTSRARPRVLKTAAGVAALAGLAGPAFAVETAAMADASTDVSAVQVTAGASPLSADTEIAVLPTTIQDTPQAVTVITNAQLRVQGITTLESALRGVPGITVSIGEGGTLNGDQFKIRGFSAQDDLYIDGLRDFGVYTRDSFAFESVQVLKGPSGALFGRGAVGGVVNILSKRPRLEEMTTLDVFAGNGGYFRALADVNHQLGETSALRLNLMVQNSGVVDRDHIFTHRWGAAASIAFGIGTPTTLTLAALHQTDHRRQDYGIIIVQRPGEITSQPASEYDVGVERSSFLGLEDDADNTEANVFTARFAHRFNDAFTLTSDARYGAYTRYFQYSTLDNCAAACITGLFDNNPATPANGGYGGAGPYDMDAQAAESLTTVRFDSQNWPMRVQLIAGADVSWQHNNKLFYAYTLPPGVAVRNTMPHDIVNPNPVMPAGYAVYLPSAGVVCPVAACSAIGTTVLESRGNAVDLAGFVSGRLWLGDQVSVIGSVRLDHYEATLDTTLVNGSVSRVETSSDLINPRVSLLWEPNDITTVYATWGRSSAPAGTSIINSGTAFTNLTGPLDPEVTTAWEVGAKVGFFGGRFALTGSVFQLTKDNATLSDPGGSGFLISQSGERDRVRGAELSATGRLPHGLSLTATYTYLDSEILQFFTNCSATTLPCAPGAPAATPTLNTFVLGRDVYFSPRHSAGVFATWDIPDTGFQVGGAAAYQDKMYTNYTVATAGGVTALSRIAVIPDLVNLDLFASYRWDRYRVAINVNNVTDRLNYVQATNNRGVPAPGRTFILSLSATF